MVSFVNGGSGTVYKRRRTNGASPPTEALTPGKRRQTGRHRKQKLMSKLSDSGFEEDLGSSPVSSPARTKVSPLRLDDDPPAERLSSWYVQYGDIGYSIQREKEAQLHPCSSLARQPQLNAEARCKLVSWLIPVHKHFHLSFECCCLTINIMDRFLACTAVAADCFQLLGVTALLLASKQVEVGSPRISHLLSLCCDAFTQEQLCNLECLILVRLNFHLAAPTMAFFLDFYTNCIEAVQLVAENTGGNRFICELSLADYAFNKFPPSLTAGCALRLASDLLKSEQGLVEHATIQSQEDPWDGFMVDLCNQPAYAGSTQPSESVVISTSQSPIVKGHFLPMGLGSYNYNLVQECKDNLKLLVSLNQETLK
uniref:G2/mitotic-specific cyclin-B2 n=1 Tax=Echeneis naucrates TaxID=173247 RepID=A0A665WG07_ECHNA